MKWSRSGDALDGSKSVDNLSSLAVLWGTGGSRDVSASLTAEHGTCSLARKVFQPSFWVMQNFLLSSPRTVS